MPKRYRLENKIDALNLLDQLDGDLQRVKSRLNIPVKTLQKWSAGEDQLRNQFLGRQDRRFDRLLSDLHLKLLERGLDILDHLTGDALADASATQLAYALNAVVSHAIKLEEIAYQLDQAAATENQNDSIRVEFASDGQTHPRAPRANGNPEPPSPLQNSRLRTPMGQNRTRQNCNSLPRSGAQSPLLVAGAHQTNDGPNLARPQKQPHPPATPENKRN